MPKFPTIFEIFEKNRITIWPTFTVTIKNDFKKGYTAMRQRSLYQSAQVVPLQSRKNLQRTFKNTRIKTFGALWRKNFKEIPDFFCHSVEPLDLRETMQTQHKNSTPFSRKSEKNRTFSDLIFSSYKNFPHAKFWYDTRHPWRSVLSMVKIWAKSQFTISRKIEQSKFAFSPMEGDVKMLWPWNSGQRSLKVIESGTIR